MILNSNNGLWVANGRTIKCKVCGEITEQKAANQVYCPTCKTEALAKEHRRRALARQYVRKAEEAKYSRGVILRSKGKME